MQVEMAWKRRRRKATSYGHQPAERGRRSGSVVGLGGWAFLFKINQGNFCPFINSVGCTNNSVGFTQQHPYKIIEYKKIKKMYNFLKNLIKEGHKHNTNNNMSRYITHVSTICRQFLSSKYTSTTEKYMGIIFSKCDDNSN